MKERKAETKVVPDNFELIMSESNNEKDTYILRLYITGSTSRSSLALTNLRLALTNLRKICEEYLKGRYELEVIDLYQKPGLAMGDQIIAAPTLIKKSPLPFRRIIGDMSNIDKVLSGLDLRAL